MGTAPFPLALPPPIGACGARPILRLIPLDPPLRVTCHTSTGCKKGKGRYTSSWEPHLRATGRHLPHGITQCYLPPDTSERAPHNPAMQAGTRFTYPGGMKGWVDLVDLIAPWPGFELTSFRSRVRRRTTAPPRQSWCSMNRQWDNQTQHVSRLLMARPHWRKFVGRPGYLSPVWTILNGMQNSLE